MADPKYAGLPGIATDQPDMFETFSDGDTDPVIVTKYLFIEVVHTVGYFFPPILYFLRFIPRRLYIIISILIIGLNNEMCLGG